MTLVVTWYHVTKFRKAGISSKDTPAINKLENSANSHNDVSKHHRKRGIHAILAKLPATVIGEPDTNGQSQANLLISNMTPGKIYQEVSPKDSFQEEKNKANDGNGNKQILNTLLQNRHDDATECVEIFVERSLTTETQKPWLFMLS